MEGVIEREVLSPYLSRHQSAVVSERFVVGAAWKND